MLSPGDGHTSPGALNFLGPYTHATGSTTHSCVVTEKELSDIRKAANKLREARRLVTHQEDKGYGTLSPPPGTVVPRGSRSQTCSA